GVAFGRIVQYQSFVMLWSTLAVLHMDRFEKEGRTADLWLTAVFLAGGLLAHYDAILVVPALLWLFFRRWRQHGVRWTAVFTAVLWGAGILLLFYLPFVSNPNFARTGTYLLRGRVGVNETTGVLSWSGPAVWQMITLYNSLYFVAGLGILVVLGCWRVWHRKEGETAVLLFLAPLIFYLFIVVDPRTHVYTFFPGAVLLASAGMDWLLGGVSRPGLRPWLVAGALAVWWFISAVYIFQIYIDNTPERVRTWAENRPSFFPTTWDEPPLYGLFGFPHHTGWRAAADWVPAAGLPYASNEEQEISAWYMAQALRTHCDNFETFILATNAQDELAYNADLLADMPVQQVVTVNGRSALKIYSRAGDPAGSPIEAADRVLWRSPAQVAPRQTGGQYPVHFTLGNGAVRLVGYDLDTRQAVPGGQVTVTLYWQALAPFAENYQVFTHLYDGEMRAQHDGAPECGIMPTTRWEPGQLIPDPHIMMIPLDTPPGEYPLSVGMYNLITEERLVVEETDQDTIELTAVTIQPGP
ncbi:MAG: hypothetical protein KC441_00050, partial [Anaerolineales bacterium]|nr:hypothetical protein [Anaerolineales bacterium]